jgi:uncharacterized protein
MKKYRLVITLLFISAVNLFAGTYNVDNIEMVHLVDSNKYVCNPDKILIEDSVAVMDDMLHKLELSTGAQVVVVAAEHYEESCFDFGLKSGNKYGVGKKKSSNGLVIVLSTGDRCISFVTGSGMEGFLPDAICKRIQVKYMNSYFGENKWSEGMTNGIRAVCAHLDGTNTIVANEGGEESSSTKDILTFIILFGGPFFFIFLITHFSVRKCPQCGKRSFIVTQTTDIGHQKERVTYNCSKCGNTEISVRNKEPKPKYAGGGGGWISGGGFGGGGGSFGGGGFSGGGSSSDF